MTNELISIVLPCYRAERFLARIIEDVLAQTYQAWELLIVSNGEGQEAQLAIARQYADKHTNIWILTSTDGGVSRARNLGMKEAKGKWLAFVDADDRITSDHLVRFIEAVAAAKEEPDIVVGGYILDQKREGIAYNVAVPNGFKKKELILRGEDLIRGSAVNKLYRTSFAQQFPFTSKYTMREDEIFNLTLFTKTDKIVTIPMTGYRYILADSGNASSKYHETLKAVLHERNSLFRTLFSQIGLSNQEIHAIEVKESYTLSYDLVRNLFKPENPFSFRNQCKEVKSITHQNPLLKEAIKQHCMKSESLLMKVWLFCLRSHSPLLTTIVFKLQYWFKKHFMTLFLRLWPYLSHKR